MRKSYDTAFKVKVAIEAAKEQETLQELSARFEVSAGQISQWKRQLLEGAGELFERPNKKQKRERETEADRDRLLSTVGKLTVENEFLNLSFCQAFFTQHVSSDRWRDLLSAIQCSLQLMRCPAVRRL